MNPRDKLQARVAMLHPGDRVEARFLDDERGDTLLVSGVIRVDPGGDTLYLGPWIVRRSIGLPGSDLQSIALDHF